MNVWLGQALWIHSPLSVPIQALDAKTARDNKTAYWMTKLGLAFRHTCWFFRHFGQLYASNFVFQRGNSMCPGSQSWMSIKTDSPDELHQTPLGRTRTHTLSYALSSGWLLQQAPCRKSFIFAHLHMSSPFKLLQMLVPGVPTLLVTWCTVLAFRAVQFTDLSVTSLKQKMPRPLVTVSGQQQAVY